MVPARTHLVIEVDQRHWRDQECASDRNHYVATLKKTLSPGGYVIIMTFAIGGPKKCSGLDIVQYDAEKLLAELGPCFELQDSGHEMHTTPAGGEQKFAWFRLIYKG